MAASRVFTGAIARDAGLRGTALPGAAASLGRPGPEASRATLSMKSLLGGILFVFAFVYAKLMVSTPLV